MENTLLLPKTPYTLKELRQKAKSQGYAIKAQTVGFDDDRCRRIVWTLKHKESGVFIAPFNVVSPDKYEQYQAGFKLLKTLCTGI